MPIDASIPLQGNKPPDPLAAAAKIYTIKAAMQQSQLGDYELQDQLTLRDASSDPRAKNPDGTMNIQSLLSLTTGKVSPKMTLTLTDAAQKQEQQRVQKQEQQRKQFEEFHKASSGPMASIYGEFKADSDKVGPEKAWEIAQPKTEALRQELTQQFQGMQLQPMTKPEQLETAARHSADFQKQQMKSTQPETPHEKKMAGIAQQRADAATSAEDQSIPPETLKFMAKQALTGDTSVMQNIGRGKQGGKNIAAFREALKTEAKEQGISPEELAARNAEFFGTKAGERALGTRTAQVGMAVSEAKRMIPLALDASEKASRSGIKSLNDITQAVQKGTASPDLRKFVAANNSLVNVYSRAVSPTGTPTVSDKDHAREVLSTGFSKGDYKAAVEQLQAEMEAAQASPGDVRKEFRGAVTGKEQKSDKPRRPLSEIFGNSDAVPR